MNYHQKAQQARNRENKRKRRERLAMAKTLGTHTKDEWLEMAEFFDYCCARCGDNSNGVVKDHIKPIYQGGSDGLDNIQPLCRCCNSSKASESIDYRPAFALSRKLDLPDNYKAKSDGERPGISILSR